MRRVGFGTGRAVACGMRDLEENELATVSGGLFGWDLFGVKKAQREFDAAMRRLEAATQRYNVAKALLDGHVIRPPGR